MDGSNACPNLGRLYVTCSDVIDTTFRHVGGILNIKKYFGVKYGNLIFVLPGLFVDRAFRFAYNSARKFTTLYVM